MPSTGPGSHGNDDSRLSAKRLSRRWEVFVFGGIGPDQPAASFSAGDYDSGSARDRMRIGGVVAACALYWSTATASSPIASKSSAMMRSQSCNPA